MIEYVYTIDLDNDQFNISSHDITMTGINIHHLHTLREFVSKIKKNRKLIYLAFPKNEIHSA